MKQTLADTAYTYLLDMILTNQIKSGDRIPEQNIISQLNISRTPVREAIRRLVADGIVDLSPGTFALVHRFTKKEMMDMGAIRITIDSLAAQFAILNGSNHDFQNLITLAAECQRAFDNNDIIERIRLDCEFHTMLTTIGGNKELISIQQRLTKRSRLMQIQSYNQEGASFCDLAGHLDIIKALMDRNVDQCLQMVHNHLKHFYLSDDNDLNLDTIRTYVKIPVYNLD